MRFLVEVDSTWAVTVRSEDGSFSRRRAMLKVDDGKGGLLPKADPATLGANEQAAVGLDNEPPEEIRALYDRVVDSQMAPGEMAAYGSYLFHNMIGSVTWAAITAEALPHAPNFIALALICKTHDTTLS